jgi:hypothetical protein
MRQPPYPRLIGLALVVVLKILRGKGAGAGRRKDHEAAMVRAGRKGLRGDVWLSRAKRTGRVQGAGRVMVRPPLNTSPDQKSYQCAPKGGRPLDGRAPARPPAWPLQGDPVWMLVQRWSFRQRWPAHVPFLASSGPPMGIKPDPLNFRDVEDLLAERGIMVSYGTVRR